MVKFKKFALVIIAITFLICLCSDHFPFLFNDSCNLNESKYDLIEQIEDENFIATIYINDNQELLFTVIRKTFLGCKSIVFSEMKITQKNFDYRLIHPKLDNLESTYYGFINNSDVTKLDFYNISDITLFDVDSKIKVFFGMNKEYLKKKEYTLYDIRGKVLLSLKDGKLFNNITHDN